MSKENRRTFLKKTGGMAVGTLSTHFPFISKAGTSSPSDQVNIALIGCRNMGFGDLKNALKQDGVQCTALCDIDEAILNERADTIEDMTGKRPKTYTDFRRVLEDKDTDAVIVGTPDHWHCLPTVYACEAGKHVYVEKPMANSIYESKQMVKAANRYGTLVQVGQQQRSGEHWKKVAEMVQNGDLGKVRRVKHWAYFFYGSSDPSVPNSEAPQTVDYDMWLGPAPQRPFNEKRFHSRWRFFWDYGGGLMTDWGVHLMDMTLWAMSIQGAPKSVSSVGGIYAYPDHAIETADTQTVVYDFGDFTYEWEHAGGIQQGYFDRLFGVAYFGTNGILVADRSGWQVYPEVRDGEYQMEAMPRQYKSGSSHEKHAANFIEAIRGNEELNCPVETGYQAALMAHLGNIAHRTGQKLYWNDETLSFENSKEANVLVKPVYRKPWELPNL